MELNSEALSARNNNCIRSGPGTYNRTRKRDFQKNLSFLFICYIANKWNGYYVKYWHFFGYKRATYTINTGSKPSTRPISNRLLGYNTTVTQFFYLWKIMMMVTATNTDAFHVLGAVPRASHVLFASIFSLNPHEGYLWRKEDTEKGNTSQTGSDRAMIWTRVDWFSSLRSSGLANAA